MIVKPPSLNDLSAVNRMVDFVLTVVKDADRIKAVSNELSALAKQAADDRAAATNEQAAALQMREQAEQERHALDQISAQLASRESRMASSEDGIARRLSELDAMQAAAIAKAKALDDREQDITRRAMQANVDQDNLRTQLQVEIREAKAKAAELDRAREAAEQLRREYEAKVAALKGVLG